MNYAIIAVSVMLLLQIGLNLLQIGLNLETARIQSELRIWQDKKIRCLEIGLVYAFNDFCMEWDGHKFSTSTIEKLR